VLGKWSILDVFILVLSLLNFRISLSSPAVLPEGFYASDIIVKPVWGLYANLIAQLLSQVSSHIIIHYHRISMSLAEQVNRRASISTFLEENVRPVGSPFPTPLYSHVFQDGKFRLCHAARWGAIAAAVATMALFIAGWSVPAFQVKTLGLLGVVADLGDNGVLSSVLYSVWNVVERLVLLVEDMDGPWLQAGLWLLIVTFTMTVAVVPATLIGVGIVLWLVPLEQHAKEAALNAVEILTAWQYVEVYVLSVIMSSLFLVETSSFMLNEYCVDLENLINFLVSAGLLAPDDARCFTLVSTLEGNVYLLIVACACLSALTKGLNWYANAVREDAVGATFSNHTITDDGLEHVIIETGWASFLFEKVAPDGEVLERKASVENVVLHIVNENVELVKSP